MKTAVFVARLILLSSTAQGTTDPASIAVAPGSVLEKPREFHPTGDYTHPSGFKFPSFVGDFRRAEVVHYDADGTNGSASYDRWRAGRAPIRATVYVYPVLDSESLEEHFDRVIQDVAKHHRGAHHDLKQTAVLCNGRYSAIYAAFRYTEPFGGLSAQPLHSYAVLYQWEGHWVKWRVTFPAPQNMNEALDAMSFLTQTVKPPNPQAGQISERHWAMVEGPARPRFALSTHHYVFETDRWLGRKDF